MPFATEWLERNSLFPQIFSEPPGNNTGIIVVVPACDEPDIIEMLNSLAACDKPDCGCEVIIVLNAKPDAPDSAITNNRNAFREINLWKEKKTSLFFNTLVFNAGQPPLKGWGVGMARKTGMDEALRRFSIIGNPDGLIVSLDADCTVEPSYFRILYNEFFRRRERKACSIKFSHPLTGVKFNAENYRYITLYELHLRYMYRGLKFSEFPDVFHTIGSAMGSRASVYMKSGGMNRRQAGEDFWFIQKLIPQGGYFELNQTAVFPSPRASSRVPFGTGAAITKMAAELESGLKTYNPEAYKDLKAFFVTIIHYSPGGSEDFYALYPNFPESIRSFLRQDEWERRVMEITGNTARTESFKKRFFGWFNMFSVVKYLNYIHSGFYDKIPVQEAAIRLLEMTGNRFRSVNPEDLLNEYRRLELCGNF